MSTTITEEPTTELYPLDRIDDAIKASRGRWVEILNDIGFPIEILNGKSHGCPVCGAAKSFRSQPDVNERGRVECDECFNSKTDIKPGETLSALRWFDGYSIGEAMCAIERTTRHTHELDN